MEYLMLITDQDADGEAWVPELDDFAAWVADADANGVRVRGNRLQPNGESTIVKRRAGGLLVTDAPLAEPEEWIAGYDVLETDSLDDAIEVASRHPRARTGHVTLHPVWPVDFDTVPTPAVADVSLSGE
ncbi:hypothetical protein J7E25_17080 [Agromyces sp. ISL-38]|uniref:YciI family protein n=1 Tax=Agromyces sp. ISL-38 TaxID=2819107 RepID=UPI001BE95D62|nr:YciI family protein [Agromyces sp. ISL-38]MBT2500812.1 hypothetical protein [Agromyces sp. ISL-38]MBT2519119.1 hypothetical protein [Streptomyces sp. ISL-90]